MALAEFGSVAFGFVFGLFLLSYSARAFFWFRTTPVYLKSEKVTLAFISFSDELISRPSSRSSRGSSIINWLSMAIRRFLDHPVRVAILCAILLCTTLVLNGNLWRLWGLHRDHDRFNSQILSTHQATKVLDSQLHQAKDPSFIERQARDRLDLADEHDLVFVFADE